MGNESAVYLKGKRERIIFLIYKVRPKFKGKLKGKRLASPLYLVHRLKERGHEWMRMPIHSDNFRGPVEWMGFGESDGSSRANFDSAFSCHPRGL